MSEHSETERIDPLRYDEEDKYLLRSERDIRLVLHSLIDRRALVSAYIAPRNRVFPTALISMSDDGHTLLIDGSANEEINRSVERAHHLNCVALLDRVHIQFRLVDLVRSPMDGQAAFRARIPEGLLRRQRREYYRLQVPVAHSLICTLPERQAQGGTLTVDLRVLDISIGGIAMAVPADHPLFKPFRELEECVLQLPGMEPIPVRLTVRNLCRQINQNGSETWRAGCQFKALPRGVDALIQRYIFRFERQRSARARGAG